MGDDLVKRLRAKNAYFPPDFDTAHASPIQVEAADRIEALEAALEAAEAGANDHAETARGKLRECHETGSDDIARVWSAIISHIDMEVERIRALRPPKGGA